MSNKKTDVFFDKAVFGGYDTTQVDEFVEEARKLLSSQKKENEVLKQKLTILADKIEEYRAAETSESTVPANQPAAVSEAVSVSAAQSESITQYEKALSSLKAQISAAKAELDAMLREKNALAASLAAQYEQCLQTMEAKPTVITVLEPVVATEPIVLEDESVVAVVPEQPSAEETCEQVVAAAEVTKNEDSEESAATLPEEKPGDESVAETVESVVEETKNEIDIELPDAKPEVSEPETPSIAESVEAGESVYLNTDPEEMAKLSYEEALAMVLKKNGILRTTATSAKTQPEEAAANAEEPKTEEPTVIREELQTTKIIPRVQITNAAPAPAPEKTQKKKKERSFFGGIKKSIHNFLEDESDDDVYPLGNNNLDKTSELKFGKAYNVKNDR